jgi:hypothetical protein
MTTRRGFGYLCVAALLAAGAAAPLHAQFIVVGCPQGPNGPHLSAITAATPGNTFEVCLIGAFNAAVSYNVQWSSPLGSINFVNVTGTTSLVVNVPSDLALSVTTPGQPDPAILSVTPTPPGGGSGTFQINPPLQAGGPVFVSAAGSPTTVNLYTGGTTPYQNGAPSGQLPPGMGAFPGTTGSWSGTPSAAGTYQYSFPMADAWGNALQLTLDSYIVPVPQITTLSPATALAGAATIPLTISGSGFVAPTTIGATPEPGSTVTWAGVGPAPTVLTPTSILPGSISVNIPTVLLAATGNFTLLVTNPSPVSSNTHVFTVTPSITALSVSSHTATVGPFPLTVTGTGFVNGSVVRMNGTALPTNFVSGASLTTTVPPAAVAGPEVFTVLNPDGTVSPASTASTLTIVAPPTVTSLNPSSATAGGPALPLAVNGSNYLAGFAIFFNGVALPTTLSGGALDATVPAALLATPNNVPVWVQTNDGYVTQAVSFTIAAATPPLQLVNFSPLTSGVAGAPYTTRITATGGTGAVTFALAGGVLPNGLQLSSGGVLSGTPATFGAYNFTVQATDSLGVTASRAYTLVIAPSPLTLTTGPLGSAPENTPLAIQFAGSGGVTPYSFVEFGALPPGTQMSASGLLSGTPTTPGTYSFLLFIDDSTGVSASQKYSITVTAPGLVITTASPLPAGQLAAPYTTQLAATGGKGATLAWYASGLPQGLTMASNTGLIAGIPRAIGTFTVGVTVQDLFMDTVTQNYTLVIASSQLTVTTASLPNGAAGSSYAATVAASGGVAPLTFAAAGLPAGVTLSAAGIFSGSPATAGSFSIVVTVTDSNGLTATATYPVTVAAKLVVSAATISTAVLDAPLTAVKLSATGGTAPYQWQAANLPPGLSLASDGTISGTPTAQGTFSFTAFVVDSSGSLSSGTVQVTVGLPAAPAVTISGLAATYAPATQPSVQISLASAYPVTVTVNLTLTFVPTSGADDPSVQFATGGRTAQIVVPAGSTGGLTAVGLQTGTVAGAITVTAHLLAGGQDVTPTPAPTRTVLVNPSAPVITSLTAMRNSTGFTVVVVGYASNRDVDTGTYQFAASEGANLLTGQLATPVTSLFTQWYQTSGSAPYGSQFSLTQPFTVQGNPATVLSVTVTLTNALGTSPAATANLQ